MEIIRTSLSGVLRLKNFTANDSRGTFIKTFNRATFEDNGLQTTFVESYYSVSHKDVIRGMHFQLPPYDHEKIVYVTQGNVLDVVVDLRRASPTYQQYTCLDLVELGDSVYIPKGFAHGFLSRSTTATVVYTVSTVYNPVADAGIRWDSIGFGWPVSQPIISDRDANFTALANFDSPF